ncbi:MAG: hypothetical protein RR573_08875 [Oscillospiraceae bacterium]
MANNKISTDNKIAAMAMPPARAKVSLFTLEVNINNNTVKSKITHIGKASDEENL